MITKKTLEKVWIQVKTLNKILKKEIHFKLYMQASTILNKLHHRKQFCKSNKTIQTSHKIKRINAK